MGAGAAHVFAIDRLPAPQLPILHRDGARERIDLIERLVVGRHLLLQGGQVDMEQQAAPGGSTGNARTGRLEGAVQFGGMGVGPTNHCQHAGLPGGDGRRNQRQQVRPGEALLAGTPKVGNLAQMGEQGRPEWFHRDESPERNGF